MNILKNKKTLIIAIVSMTMVLVVAVIFFIYQDKDYTRDELVARQELLNKNRSLIDTAVAKTSDMKITWSEELALRQEINKMPEISLALPNYEWFTDDRLRLIALKLGFSQEAQYTDLGQTKVWTQGNNTLSIDTVLGVVEYSRNFNLGIESDLPDASPSQDSTVAAIQDFLEEASIYSGYYDFESVSYGWMGLNNDLIIIETEKENSSMVRVDIPYTVSGVQLILPVESFVILDSNNDIQVLKLLLLNLQETGNTISKLDSYQEAKNKLSQGIGIVVDSDFTDVEIEVTSSEIAYYLNQSQFYGTNQKRIPSPIYLFGGDSGAVAVLAKSD